MGPTRLVQVKPLAAIDFELRTLELKRIRKFTPQRTDVFPEI
ncbi:MAG: hypothetical protein NTX48_03195 [Planctomycetales bacterium]|nr:hypothetical protein [Planctomycetales bacterium]